MQTELNLINSQGSHDIEHDINRFAQFAVRVWNVENSFFTPEKTAIE